MIFFPSYIVNVLTYRPYFQSLLSITIYTKNRIFGLLVIFMRVWHDKDPSLLEGPERRA
jgi:hypothetical protein